MLIPILTLITTVIAAGNPGVLIAIPFPLNVPTVPLGLPLSLDDIVVNQLELTNLKVREVDY